MSGLAAPQISDAHADRVLNAVLSRLQLVLTSATHVEPGHPVTAAVVPASPEIDASELADGLLNLTWAAKDVLFPNKDAVDLPDLGTLNGESFEGDELAKDLANATGFAGQPFPPPLPGGTTLNKTPGMLAQLFGTFAVPLLKVGFRIRWVVRDQAGNELKEGDNFIASQGLTSPAVSLLLPPIFHELRLDTLTNPVGSVVCLSAEVTLSLGARTLPTSTLGPVPVLLLPLLIPTVVVLFSEPNFGLTHDSSALIIVPKHSPFASAEPLFKTLKKIEAVVSALRGIGGLAAFFLGLDELLGTVPDQPRLRFAAADEIPKLGAIKIKRRPWYQFLGEDPNWDDEAFSLIVFGMPGTRVQFFNDTNFEESNQGNFDILLLNLTFNVPPVLDFFVAVRTLDTDDDVAPETFPPSTLATPRVPSFNPDTQGDGVWHTDMSSVRFHGDWLGAVVKEIGDPPTQPPLVCSKIVVTRPRPRKGKKRASRKS